MEGYTLSTGNREFTSSGNTTYSRRTGTTDWKLVETSPPEPKPTLAFSLVRRKQSPGEPYHWSLFVHYDTSTTGSNYEVRGDATFMYHNFADHLDLLNSDSVQDSYDIATISQAEADCVKSYAEQ